MGISQATQAVVLVCRTRCKPVQVQRFDIALRRRTLALFTLLLCLSSTPSAFAAIRESSFTDCNAQLTGHPLRAFVQTAKSYTALAKQHRQEAQAIVGHLADTLALVTPDQHVPYAAAATQALSTSIALIEKMQERLDTALTEALEAIQQSPALGNSATGRAIKDRARTTKVALAEERTVIDKVLADLSDAIADHVDAQIPITTRDSFFDPVPETNIRQITRAVAPVIEPEHSPEPPEQRTVRTPPERPRGYLGAIQHIVEKYTTGRFEAGPNTYMPAPQSNTTNRRPPATATEAVQEAVERITQITLPVGDAPWTSHQVGTLENTIQDILERLGGLSTVDLKAYPKAKRLEDILHYIDNILYILKYEYDYRYRIAYQHAILQLFRQHLPNLIDRSTHTLSAYDIAYYFEADFFRHWQTRGFSGSPNLFYMGTLVREHRMQQLVNAATPLKSHTPPAARRPIVRSGTDNVVEQVAGEVFIGTDDGQIQVLRIGDPVLLHRADSTPERYILRAIVIPESSSDVGPRSAQAQSELRLEKVSFHGGAPLGTYTRLPLSEWHQLRYYVAPPNKRPSQNVN